ncbi:MAG TPA: FkbM family methyltransferase [Roseiarcus sp.]|nr:FkbM family methyltransferase [Roseiarcus sp.]
MNQTVLPNGLQICEINKHETKFVYKEIFVDRVYDRHNISLDRNAIVFDVGANIGLFALYASLNFPQVKLYCFEPAPHCREVLSLNVARFGEDAKVIGAALGAAPGELEFTYYPNNTIMSSLVADLDRDQRAVAASLQAEYELRSGERIEERFLSTLVAKKLEHGVRFKCPVTTISSVMDAENISRISLAKIDVECAESLVLDGIEDRHWDRIDHFVIEVHDQGADEPRKMRDRIEAKNFDVELFKAPILVESDIYELSAKRRR